MRPLFLPLVLLCLHATTAVATPTAGDSCVAEFLRCEATCHADNRPCVTSCAKHSALCQQAAAVPPMAASMEASGALPFAFTDVNGDRFLPFGSVHRGVGE